MCAPLSHVRSLLHLNLQPLIAPTLPAMMRMRAGMRTRMRSYNNVKYWTRLWIETYMLTFKPPTTNVIAADEKSKPIDLLKRVSCMVPIFAALEGK